MTHNSADDDTVRAVGMFAVTIGIENPGVRGQIRVLPEALVDTGSEFTWVPVGLLESLGIRAERSERFVLADGSVLTRQIGFAIVHLGERASADDVVFAETGDFALLGARSLEGLNLRVDPRERRLVPRGPIITAGRNRKAQPVQRRWMKAATVSASPGASASVESV